MTNAYMPRGGELKGRTGFANPPNESAHDQHVGFAPRLVRGGGQAGDELRIMSLVRNSQSGEISADATIWTLPPNGAVSGYDLYMWMRERPERWQIWARLATMAGTFFTSILQGEVQADAAERARLEVEAAARLQEEEIQRANENRIVAKFYNLRNGRYEIALELAGSGDSVWEIQFAEKWERQRFWDWLGAHEPRFPEFASSAQDLGWGKLEALLLHEMLVVEREVKARGLSAGGRRPLRFWRGGL